MNDNNLMDRQSRICNVYNDNSVWVDVDDTLVIWDYPSDIDPTKLTTIVGVEGKGELTFLVHKRHVDFVKRLYNQGLIVIVWSAGGSAWAAHIVNELGLNKYVHLTMSKPRFMLDDLEASQFMPKRTFLDLLNPMEDKDEEQRFHDYEPKKD